MSSRHKRDVHLKCRQTLSKCFFFLKYRQCRPAPQAGAYLICSQCSPSTRVLVSTAQGYFFSNIANAVPLQGYDVYLKFHQRRSAIRVPPMLCRPKGKCFPLMPPTPSGHNVLISTAANAIPPQEYMFFFLEFHQRRPPQLPQTPSRPRVFVFSRMAPMAFRHKGISLNCCQRRPAKRVYFFSNAANAVPPQGC